MAVTVNATECWDLPALEEIRKSGGIDTVRAALAAGDDLGRLPGHDTAGPASPAAPGNPAGSGEGTHPFVFANGFALSPYAETGGPGGNIKHPPRTLWHASPGSTASPDALPPGPVSAGLGRVEAVPAFTDGRHDLGDPGVEGVKFFRLGRVGDERTSVT
jgi:hypothetical protein